MGGFFSWDSKAEKWGAQGRLGECSQSILPSYPLSNNRQGKQCDGTKHLCFLENKSRLENEARNAMQMGITKKAHHWWMLEEPQILFHASFTVASVLQQILVTLAKLLKADQLLHWWVAFPDKKDNIRERKRIKSQVCYLRELAVKKPEDDKRWARRGRTQLTLLALLSCASYVKV